MPSSLICLWLCFIAVSTNPTYNAWSEDQVTANFQRDKELIGKKLFEIIEDFKVIQLRMSTQAAYFFKMKALKTQQMMSSYSKECKDDVFDLIEIERKKRFADYLSCSLLDIIRNVAELAIDTSSYIIQVSKDGTLIVSEFATCSSSLNPFSIIYCIYETFKVLPKQIQDIIVLSENYKTDFENLLPKIVQGVESCFNKTSNEYEVYLLQILDKVRGCEKLQV